MKDPGFHIDLLLLLILTAPWGLLDKQIQTMAVYDDHVCNASFRVARVSTKHIHYAYY